MSPPPVRVAIVAPLVSPIADPFLGGSQAIVHDLAAGLAGAGHPVTVFAADASAIPGVEMIALGIDSRRLRPTSFSEPQPPDAAVAAEERACFLRIAYEVRRRAEDFDVVHNHAFDAPPFELLPEAHRHVVHTLHLPPAVPAVRAAVAAARGGAALVCVSQWSARQWQAHAGTTQIVRNGVPVARIGVGRGPRRGWLFVGRITPEKGLHDAMQAAEQAGRRLRIAGGVYDAAYHERVRARLLEHETLGPLHRDEVFRQMAGAEGLLMPVGWDEPFGLTAVEAMAAGTPVAAYARGALPEVIAAGQTGYLVAPGDVDGLRSAAERFSALDPAACRRWVEERFTTDRMVDEYVRLYRTIA